jgi:hypothetical protein
MPLREVSPKSGRVLLRHAAAKCRRSVAYYCYAAYSPALIWQIVWKQFRLSGDKSRKLLSAMFEHSGAGCGLW